MKHYLDTARCVKIESACKGFTYGFILLWLHFVMASFCDGSIGEMLCFILTAHDLKAL
ncbi:MAG TPA: hypothetical protein VF600_04685 [Abditibacteriaceae bacterium]|jgi:hypothetical protein